MQFRIWLAGLIAAVAMSGNASAGPCVSAAYSDYLATGFSCTVEDKTFSSFSFTSSAGGSGMELTSGDVTVQPETNSDGPGLLFSSTAISVTQSTAITGDTFVDVSLGFTVTAGGGFLIDDASLDAAGGATGGGMASIDETVSTVPPGPVPPMHVGFGGAVPPPESGMITFGPVPVVDVSKDILVEVPAGMTGNANITEVTQEFSQVSTPEPTSLVLLGTALVSIGLFRRRRNKDQ